MNNNSNSNRLKSSIKNVQSQVNSNDDFLYNNKNKNTNTLIQPKVVPTKPVKVEPKVSTINYNMVDLQKKVENKVMIQQKNYYSLLNKSDNKGQKAIQKHNVVTTNQLKINNAIKTLSPEQMKEMNLVPKTPNTVINKKDMPVIRIKNEITGAKIFLINIVILCIVLTGIFSFFIIRNITSKRDTQEIIDISRGVFDTDEAQAKLDDVNFYYRGLNQASFRNEFEETVTKIINYNLDVRNSIGPFDLIFNWDYVDWLVSDTYQVHITPKAGTYLTGEVVLPIHVTRSKSYDLSNLDYYNLNLTPYVTTDYKTAQEQFEDEVLQEINDKVLPSNWDPDTSTEKPINNNDVDFIFNNNRYLNKQWDLSHGVDDSISEESRIDYHNTVQIKSNGTNPLITGQTVVINITPQCYDLLQEGWYDDEYYSYGVYSGFNTSPYFDPKTRRVNSELLITNEKSIIIPRFDQIESNYYYVPFKENINDMISFAELDAQASVINVPGWGGPEYGHDPWDFEYGIPAIPDNGIVKGGILRTMHFERD